MARSTWGSIKPKSRGVWELRYTVGGQRHSKTVRGTKAEAERELANLRVLYEDAETSITLSQFWVGYYLAYIKSTLAEATVVGYVRYYEHDIAPVFGDMLLTDIKPLMIQRWLDTMTGGAAKHARAVLSSILSYACTMGLINDNVALRRFTLPKTMAKGQRSKDVFTFEELVEIYEECEGEDWACAYTLASFGGASREEALSPLAEEVEEKDDFAVIPVVRGIQRLDGEVRIVDKPKNRYREDFLVIPPPYSHRVFTRAGEAKENGEIWLSDDGFGMPMCPNNMATAYKRWFLGKPYRYVPFSNLRNSYSTVLHSLGLEDSFVSKVMRHSNLQTDYTNYNRLSVDDKIAGIRKALG